MKRCKSQNHFSFLVHQGQRDGRVENDSQLPVELLGEGIAVADLVGPAKKAHLSVEIEIFHRVELLAGRLRFRDFLSSHQHSYHVLSVVVYSYRIIKKYLGLNWNSSYEVPQLGSYRLPSRSIFSPSKLFFNESSQLKIEVIDNIAIFNLSFPERAFSHFGHCFLEVCIKAEHLVVQVHIT